MIDKTLMDILIALGLVLVYTLLTYIGLRILGFRFRGEKNG